MTRIRWHYRLHCRKIKPSYVNKPDLFRYLSGQQFFNLWPSDLEELQTISKRSMADKSEKQILLAGGLNSLHGEVCVARNGGTAAAQCGPALNWLRSKSLYLQDWQFQEKYFDQHPRIMRCFVFPSTSRNIVPAYFQFQARLLWQFCSGLTALWTRINFNSLRMKGGKTKRHMKSCFDINIISAHLSFGFTSTPVGKSHSLPFSQFIDLCRTQRPPLSPPNIALDDANNPSCFLWLSLKHWRH